MNILKVKYFVLICFGFFFWIPNLKGQALEFGVGAGTWNYKGDLATHYNLSDTQPSAELFFKYNLHHFIALKAGFNYAWIGSKDANTPDPFQQKRNFQYAGDLYDLSGALEYNFFSFRNESRRKWSPYIFVGGGWHRFAIQEKNYQEQSIAKYQNQLVMPFGIGLKKIIHKQWNFNAEFRTIKTFGDIADSFEMPTTGNPSKFQRVNPKNEDYFYYLGISLSYVYQGIKCPLHPVVK